MNPSHKFLFFFLMALAMTAWGGSWVSAKIIANDAAPEVLTFWRFVVTVVSFLPVLVFYRKSLRLDGRSFLQTALGAMLIVGYNKFFFRGLQTGFAGAAGVLVTTYNPILTFLLAIYFFKRPLRLWVIIGLLLGLVGGMIQLHVWSLSLEQLLLSGNLFFIAASTCWAFLTITTEKTKNRLHPLIFSFYTYLFATVLIFFLALPYDIGSALDHGAMFWLNVIYLAVFATTFATTVYFTASAKVGSNRASSFIFLVPFSAVTLSWLLLGEIPRWPTLLGGVVAIAAVWMLNTGGKDTTIPPAPTPPSTSQV
jgi:drug/metabolite transporter (DMT)-like permease